MDENLFHFLLPPIAGAGHAGHSHHSHFAGRAGSLPSASGRMALAAPAVAASANPQNSLMMSGNVSTNGSGLQSTAGAQQAGNGVALGNVADWYLRYSSIYVVPVVIVLGVRMRSCLRAFPIRVSASSSRLC